MKKKLLIAMMLVMAVSATACSKKKEAETTAAPETTTVAPTTTEAVTTEETTAEDVDEDSMTGTITAVTDTSLTVTDDSDQKDKTYDISKADVINEFPITAGDLVEITFPEGTTADPIPAIHVEIMESVVAQNTDPSVEGTIEDGTMNNLVLKLDDGTSYTFGTSNAYIVAADGIVIGKKATVTYIGDLEDTEPIPLAVKVVTEDSYDTPEADLFAFVGDVVQVEEDSIVLESADGDFYTFVSSDLDFSTYQKGDSVKVFYTGTITNKAIPADKIEKN